MNRLIGILLWAGIGILSFAEVAFRTNIQDLYYRGTCEEVGAITMSVSGNDFASASIADPIFIRLRLGQDAVLCSSLVGSWQVVEDIQTTGFMGQPIFLAIRMGGAPNTIAADPETVSIVRWIEGENAIWLRIQSSSNNWIYNSATSQTGPPSPSNGSVAWTFGISAAKSVQLNAYYSVNLPANTRDSSYTTCGPGIAPNYPAISTFICVNLEDSILAAFPDPGSILTFDATSFRDTAWSGDFGVFTAMPGVAIDTGSPSTPSFSGDDSIARGIEGNCTATIYHSSPVYETLCVDAVGQGYNGLVLLENELTIDSVCSGGWHTSSYISFHNANNGPWGFPLQIDSEQGEIIEDLYHENDDIYQPGMIPSASRFIGANSSLWFVGPLKNSGGYYFADNLIMWYDSPGSTTSANTLLVNLEVGQFISDAPGPVEVGVDVWISDKDSRWDGGTPPYGMGPCDVDNLADSPNYFFANDYCPPSRTLATQAIWEFGGFMGFIPGNLETNPSGSIAQGIYHLVLSATGDFPCTVGPRTIQWENVTDGIFYGVNHPSVQFGSPLTKSTDFRVTASDDTGILSVKDITILVPINPGFSDMNLDMCNDLNDLHILCSKWQNDYKGDPNNDGMFNILDLMYINVSGICITN